MRGFRATTARFRSVNAIFFGRAIDRFAKGFRSLPTDALIADSAPKAR